MAFDVPSSSDFLQADFGLSTGGLKIDNASYMPVNTSLGTQTKYNIFDIQSYLASKAFSATRIDDGISGVRKAKIFYIGTTPGTLLPPDYKRFIEQQVVGFDISNQNVVTIYAAPEGGSCAVDKAPTHTEPITGKNPENPDFTRICRLPRFFIMPGSAASFSLPIVGQTCNVQYIKPYEYGEYKGMLNAADNLVGLNNISTGKKPAPSGAAAAFFAAASAAGTVGTHSGGRVPRSNANREGIAGRAFTTGKDIPNASFGGLLQGFYSRRNFRKPATLLVIHESGMDHLGGLEQTLLSKRGGVHYTVSGGKAYQYSSLERRLVHCAGGKNDIALGIEFNHAYSAGASKKEQLKPAVWFARKRYAIPSLAQCEALYGLVDHICKKTGIPFNFAMIRNNQFDMKKGNAASATTGIVSHSAVIHHCDGNFPSLYMAIRQLGYSPEASHKKTIDLFRNTDSSGKARGVKSNAKIALPPPGPSSPVPNQITVTPKLVMSEEKFWEEEQSWARRNPKDAARVAQRAAEKDRKKL